MSERDAEVTDVLIFLDVPHVGGRHIVGWSGDWPPPERMVLVWQGSTGRVGTVTEVEHMTPHHLAAMAQMTLEPHYYRLRNASQIKHPARPDEFWFRGAEYVPEVDPPE